MDQLAVERRLAAILAADIVGYSRLVEKDETGTLAAIRKLRAEIVDPLLARHHGRIVKLMGDGAIAEFSSVVDAVSCAVGVQKGITAAQAEVSSDRRIIFRIGINLGDVVVEGDDLLGDGVNVAARLEQLCDPGGVLISGAAYDQLQGKFSLPLDFAGEQHVKNISRLVRTYRIRLEGSGQPWRLRLRQHAGRMRWAAAIVLAFALAGGAAWWMRPVDAAGATPSIAVLPFDNLGGDEATGRLADGITEDIITDLARFRGIEVIARNSTMVYANQAVDVREVGRDLHVRYVLEGSIQRQADQVRVTAQLVEAATAAHVWSERWDRPVEDVFAVQTELAEQVATSLGDYPGTLMAADREAARRKRPTDLTAYDLYLLGVEAKHQMTEENLNRALDLLNRSIEIDPNFARAWTALSWTYALNQAWTDDWDENYRHQLETAQKAVELDPLDAEARSAFAWALADGGEFAKSEVQFEQALNLNPNSADVLTWYAGWAVAFGKADEGADAADRALRLNPDTPTWAVFMLRIAYVSVGRFEDAFRVHSRMPREMYQSYDYVMAAVILAGLGRQEEAREAGAAALVAHPWITVEGWVGYSGTGTWGEVRQSIIDLMRQAGFPVCASPADLEETPDLVRLPECLQA